VTQGTWQLAWTAQPAHPQGVVLVLHGGKDRSRRPARWRNTAALRMLPFARAAAAAGGGDLAVVRLLHSVRGWNGPETSPVADAREALQEIRTSYPGIPLGLLGHSMGGRTALYLAEEPDVRVIVCLAPWVERTDRPLGGAGLRVMLAHGTRDRITSPQATRWLAGQLASRGVDVTYRSLPGEGHALLRHPWQVQQTAADFMARGLSAARTCGAAEHPDQP
jgi:alpha-beta hydrolase superfamily lysophospholipase